MERKNIRVRVARELRKYPSGSLIDRLWSVKNFFAGMCAYMTNRNEFKMAKEYAQYHEYVTELIEFLLEGGEQ